MTSTAQRAPSTWLTFAEACVHVRAHADKVRDRMKRTPEHIAPAWINDGLGARNSWKFKTTEVDRWWEEVNAWLRQDHSTAGTKSAGVSPAPRASSPKSARTASTPHANATSSSGPSSDAKRSSSGTSRLALLSQTLRSATD